MAKRLLIPCVWLAAVLVPAPAHACFCKYVAAKVDRVVFEPSRETPERVQIHGGFAFREGIDFPPTWREPVRGYLYFECDAGRETDCRHDWEQLALRIESRAGCSAFGDTVVAETARVRPSTEPPAEPDTYVPGFGVGGFDGVECEDLADAPEPGPTLDTREPGLRLAAPDGGAAMAPAPRTSAGCAVANDPAPLGGLTPLWTWLLVAWVRRPRRSGTP